MNSVSVREILLHNVALAFPLEGGISQLSRRISACYSMAYDRVMEDPWISANDRRVQIGHQRRCYVNTAMSEMAAEHPEILSAMERKEGEEGFNNRVEFSARNFVITHHHHYQCPSMPTDFLRLKSSYGKKNAMMNDPMQGELFTPEQIVNPNLQAKPMNLLILHENNDETLSEVGRIEFVFPKKSRKFVALSVNELVQMQGYLLDLEPDDLMDFQRKSAEGLRRIAG